MVDRVCPTADVSQLAAYDAIKASLIASAGFKDNVQTHLTTGVLAGTLATTVAAPFDVLKSRIQSSHGTNLVRRSRSFSPSAFVFL